MCPGMSDPARNIAQAYFDTLWRHDDDVWTHPTVYVDRRLAQGDGLPIHARLRDELLRARGDVKRLFTGQVGVGKSTELGQLVSDPELCRRYAVVVIDAGEKLNLARFVDVRYLLVAFAEGLARACQEASEVTSYKGFAIERATQIREWIRIVSAGVPLPDSNQIDPRAFAKALAERLTGITGQLKTDDSLKKGLRGAEVSEVRNLVVLLADELVRETERDVLVVVDDLDKIRDRETLEHLFRDHLSTLRGLNLKWIVTMPYALRFDPGMQVPHGLIATLPNVKIVRRGAPGELLAPAAAFFRAVLESLVDPSLVQQAVVDRAVLLSAGIPREFLRTVHKAFGVAHYAGAAVVQPGHLATAEIQLRNELQPLHADSATKLRLELVRARPDELDAAQRELMATLLVVEYSNDVQWYDVHPLLVEEYDRRLAQRAERLGIPITDRVGLAEDLLKHLG